MHAYKKAIRHFHKQSLRPLQKIMDNECSHALKDLLDKECMEWHIVLQDTHIRNTVEEEINMFKYHFLEDLAVTDKDSPIHLWYHLVQQSCRNPNLLFNSRNNPQLFSESQMNVQYGYNWMPLLTPVIKLITCNKSEKRRSREAHVSKGWYVGEALVHYQCFSRGYGLHNTDTHPNIEPW